MLEHNVEEKGHLRSFVLKLIQERLNQVERFTEFTVEASRDIKKTPKYDSIREEVQNEIFNLDKQVYELRQMMSTMKRVIASDTEEIRWGSVVITNKARFYISVSLGEFFYKNDRFYAISLESPLAQKMIGLKPGDEFQLNGIHQKIVVVF